MLLGQSDFNRQLATAVPVPQSQYQVKRPLPCLIVAVMCYTLEFYLIALPNTPSSQLNRAHCIPSHADPEHERPTFFCSCPNLKADERVEGTLCRGLGLSGSQTLCAGVAVALNSTRAAAAAGRA